MQILISCAKDMTPAADAGTGLTTTPMFLEEAMQNASVMAGFSEEDLERILKISPRIAAENFDRYRKFNTGLCTQGPAVFSYTGIAYKHLKPWSWSEDDCIFANSHLWICSFLYGLLRPMDMISPYRLEGNIRLHENKTMFDFWKPLLTEALIKSVENDGGTLIHLATEEMTHLFDWTKVCEKVRVVEPKFYSESGKKKKVVTVHAKMCRGAMSSYIIRNRTGNPDDLSDFAYDGYEFKYTDGNEMYFFRTT